MKKIDEFTENKWRTIYAKDANGKKVRLKEEYIGKRPVGRVGLLSRFLHYIIDSLCILFCVFSTLLILFLIIALISRHNYYLLSHNKELQKLIYYLLFLIIYILFYLFFEYKWQKTPGKFMTRSIVINIYGNKPTLKQVFLRSLIRLVPFDGISCLSDSNPWHDRWVETFLVTGKEFEELKRLQQEQEI